MVRLITKILPCLLLLTLCRNAPAQTRGDRLSVYVVDFKTNLKGELATLAVDLSTVIETAFSRQRAAFRVLERRNLSDVIAQHKMEKDLQSLINGEGVSARLRTQLRGADGFIRGELVERIDGVRLTVYLVLADSEKVWQGDRTHTKYEWLSTKIQEDDARSLAAEAAAGVRPVDLETPVQNDGPRGIELARAGKCKEAAGMLEVAATIDTGNAELLYWLGRCQNGFGEYGSASRSLTKALARNSHRSDLFAERARSFAGLGDAERARDDLDRALTLDANNGEAIELRGDLLMQAGHYEDALAAFSYVYQLGATAERCNKLAEAYRRNGAASAAAKTEQSCRQLQ